MQPPSDVAVPREAFDESTLKTLTFVSYGLLLAGVFMGVTALVAVILAYIKKDEAKGTIWHSHFRNVIVVFWVTFATFLLGLVTVPVAIAALFAGKVSLFSLSGISLPILFAVVIFPVFAIWFLYRLIRGIVHAQENRAY